VLTTTKLAEMPTEGRVVVGHPDHELEVAAAAGLRGEPYYLSSRCPLGSVYMLDMDLIFTVPEVAL
jgi:hypothetical protein